MRLRTGVVTGGTAIGVAAVINALLTRRVAPLVNPLGGEEGWYHWRRHRVFFTRRGQGKPLLLVHGIHLAAWSYEWRHTVDALARSYTVHTLDLLGFGLSARPDVAYSMRLYTSLVADFAAQVIGSPTVLVASGVSAAHAIVLGARDPGRFPALVLVCPTGIARMHESPDGGDDVRRIAFDTPLIGTAMYNALVSRRKLRALLLARYADDTLVTDALVEAYYAAAHQPGAKHAPSALIGDQLNADVRQPLRRLAQPSLLVWGEQARETPLEDLHGFRILKPDLEVAVLDPAGDLPHDERPREFNELVLGFLARLEQRQPGPVPLAPATDASAPRAGRTGGPRRTPRSAWRE